MRHSRPVFKALRLSEDEFDKLTRLGAMYGTENFSATVRRLIHIAPEPAELSRLAMAQAQQAMAAQRG